MMNKMLNIIAKTLSILLYPMWIPTYGMALFCFASYQIHLPITLVYAGFIVGGTFVLTTLIPLSILLIAIHRGKVSDLQISNATERTMPYLYTAICYAFWPFLLRIIEVPFFLRLVAIGAFVALCIVMFINIHWKISAHLTGLGGLIGGIFAFQLYYGIIPSNSLIISLFMIALALMYARLWLRAHTDWQVIAGFCLGLTATALPTYIALL